MTCSKGRHTKTTPHEEERETWEPTEFDNQKLDTYTVTVSCKSGCGKDGAFTVIHPKLKKASVTAGGFTAVAPVESESEKKERYIIAKYLDEPGKFEAIKGGTATGAFDPKTICEYGKKPHWIGEVANTTSPSTALKDIKKHGPHVFTFACDPKCTGGIGENVTINVCGASIDAPGLAAKDEESKFFCIFYNNNFTKAGSGQGNNDSMISGSDPVKDEMGSFTISVVDCEDPKAEVSLNYSMNRPEASH